MGGDGEEKGEGGGARREVRRNVKLQGWSSLTVLPVVIEVK